MAMECESHVESRVIEHGTLEKKIQACVERQTYLKLRRLIASDDSGTAVGIFNSELRKLACGSLKVQRAADAIQNGRVADYVTFETKQAVLNAYVDHETGLKLVLNHPELRQYIDQHNLIDSLARFACSHYELRARRTPYGDYFKTDFVPLLTVEEKAEVAEKALARADLRLHRPTYLPMLEDPFIYEHVPLEKMRAVYEMLLREAIESELWLYEGASKRRDVYRMTPRRSKERKRSLSNFEALLKVQVPVDRAEALASACVHADPWDAYYFATMYLESISCLTETEKRRVQKRTMDYSLPRLFYDALVHSEVAEAFDLIKKHPDYQEEFFPMAAEAFGDLLEQGKKVSHLLVELPSYMGMGAFRHQLSKRYENIAKKRRRKVSQVLFIRSLYQFCEAFSYAMGHNRPSLARSLKTTRTSSPLSGTLRQARR